MALSGYIPCYNNESTIAAAVASLQRQTVSVADLLVVDDGSADRSPELAAAAGARVVRLPRNLGRGAVNARAMDEARHDLVLCCGATNVLAEDFAEKARPWFDDPRVAAVFGHIRPPPSKSAVDRWRARHLFKAGTPAVVRHQASLGTTGSMLRKSLVQTVGNFNAALRHSEDADLGARLLAAGYDVVADPALAVIPNKSNTLREAMERYWRWYAGTDEAVSWRGYLKITVYSIKVMAVQDWRERDPWSIPISLLCPHFQFWRSWWRGKRGAKQQA